jgi:hypothetical protein
MCNACEQIANCIYLGAGGCKNGDVPSCLCDKGFEKKQISSGYVCAPCEQGKYKISLGDGDCTAWDMLSCGSDRYAAFGTRLVTSVCLNYPNAPDNAHTEARTWTCNKGFEKAT